MYSQASWSAAGTPALLLAAGLFVAPWYSQVLGCDTAAGLSAGVLHLLLVPCGHSQVLCAAAVVACFGLVAVRPPALVRRLLGQLWLRLSFGLVSAFWLKLGPASVILFAHHGDASPNGPKDFCYMLR